MPIIEFGQRDILRGKPVPPAWYVISVESVGEKLSRDQGSTNFPVESTIVCNDDDGSTDFAGVPIDFLFNSKAIGFAAGFLKAMGYDIQAGNRVDLGKVVGKKVAAYIKNDQWEGRTVNRVTHEYRKPRQENV
jgi:hypothetical protein